MFTKILILIAVATISYNCSSSYQELKNGSFKAEKEFSYYLLKEYEKKAHFEAKEMHDWDSAHLYSNKALLGYHGQEIKPQKISYWKIPSENILEIKKAYENLMKVYKDAIKINPLNLAKAISSLDCWAEQQEENWQADHIKNCRKDYLESMHNIFNSIKAENENKITESTESDNKNKKNQEINDLNKETVSIVTKDKNEKILHIIYFDFDKSNISEYTKIEIFEFLKNNRKKIHKYLLVGHADTKGTNDYNLKLSLERASRTKKVLIEAGISKNDIKIIGKGETSLLVNTDDEVSHPANRRVEISSIN